MGPIVSTRLHILYAVTNPNDVVANKSVSRQVATYDMRSQEWRTKELQKTNLDDTKTQLVYDSVGREKLTENCQRKKFN